VYNGERYVATAIQSLLAQTLADFELIITDNASTDATQRICEGFAARDSRIRYVRSDRNIGAAANFNRGFELARGEYFKWCAHDDFISPNFVQDGVRALEAEPRGVAAYGRLEYVDDAGNVISRDWGTPDVSVFEKTFPDMRGLSASRRYAMLIHAGGSDNVMFGIMRRSALAKTSLHRKYYMSDRALLVELVVHGIFVHAPQITLFNRDHSQRSTRLADKLTRTTWTNPSVQSGYCFEHLSLLRQHFDTAWSARQVAPLPRTLASLLVWAMNPMRMAWCALEVIGIVSPGLRQALGRFAWRAVNLFRGAARLRPAGAVND
jgi:glycosyltransferase involved in cell wall biosynthesis